MNVEIISGSPRKDSLSHRVVLFLQKYLSEKTEHNVNIIDVRDWGFPLLQQEVFSSVERAPEELKPLQNACSKQMHSLWLARNIMAVIHLH
jgi:NAD(P)H-dependent FMN reductase